MSDLSLASTFTLVKPDDKFPFDPTDFGRFVEAWQNDNQREMTVVDLLNIAERDNSKWHIGFEWDNVAAAHSFRQAQAAYYLNSIRRKLELDASTIELQPRRDWLKPVVLGEIAQQKVVQKTATRDLRQSSVKIAYNELRAWSKKWNDYTELDEARELVSTAIELSGYPKKTNRRAALKRTKKK